MHPVCNGVLERCRIWGRLQRRPQLLALAQLGEVEWCRLVACSITSMQCLNPWPIYLCTFVASSPVEWSCLQCRAMSWAAAASALLENAPRYLVFPPIEICAPHWRPPAFLLMPTNGGSSSVSFAAAACCWLLPTLLPPPPDASPSSSDSFAFLQCHRQQCFSVGCLIKSSAAYPGHTSVPQPALPPAPAPAAAS